MGTRTNPGLFDCYAAALPDEPLFTLLARDPQAATLVKQWAMDRMALVANGLKPVADLDAVREALELADRMTEWRRANDGKWRAPPEMPAREG